MQMGSFIFISDSIKYIAEYMYLKPSFCTGWRVIIGTMSTNEVKKETKCTWKKKTYWRFSNRGVATNSRRSRIDPYKKGVKKEKKYSTLLCLFQVKTSHWFLVVPASHMLIISSLFLSSFERHQILNFRMFAFFLSLFVSQMLLTLFQRLFDVLRPRPRLDKNTKVTHAGRINLYLL